MGHPKYVDAHRLETWNYPLHVGSILGSADEDPLAGDLCDPHDTACDWHLVVVAASPVRPARTAPQRDRCPPRWLVVTVTATSILLPVLGLSVVVLLVGEQLVARLRKQ